MSEKLYEKQIKRTPIYDGKIINVVKDTVELPNGNTSFREVVFHNGGVCAVVKEQNDIFFVKQFRYPFQSVVLELPAGKIEKGENPDETIIRELEEEIGVEVTTIEKIGTMYSSPGFTNEVIHLYYTEKFVKTLTHFDEDEFLEVVKIDIEQVYEMIERGEIVDGKTVFALLKIKERLKGE